LALQIIYAAPFVFLSIVSFSICLAIRPLRRFAIPALIVPVTFGFFSILGWIAFVLIAGFVLKLHLGPATGIHGIAEGLLFYLVPGVLASWAAIVVARFVENRLLRTQFAKDLMLRIVVSAVGGFAGGIVGFGVASSCFPSGYIFATFLTAAITAGLVAILASLLTMTIQRRVEQSRLPPRRIE
jgi:hypothetical protein